MKALEPLLLGLPNCESDPSAERPSYDVSYPNMTDAKPKPKPERKAPRLAPRADYGSGCYRRRIRLEAGPASALGELADDFHHFAVDLTVLNGRVATVRGQDIRVPWTTCPGAVEPLQKMIGAEVTAPLSSLMRHTPARAQCTHLHDLTCLVIAHAARVERGGPAVRVYDVELPDRVAGRTKPTLRRDGQTSLAWTVEGSTIVDSAPPAFVDHPLSGRVFQETLAGLADSDTDLAEAAWILQRAVFVGTGRRHDFEQMPDATHFAPVVGAACHSFSEERVESALRIYGTVRDFTTTPERIFERSTDNVESK